MASIRAAAARAIDAAIGGAIRVTGLNRAGAVSSRIAEHLRPVRHVAAAGRTLRIACPNRLTRWRADTFLTKEPDMIRWIDSFAPGDVFFDIGANIGLYTLYAAARGARVTAFEPEASNYAELARNLYLNQFDGVRCLPIALSNTYGPDTLFLSAVGAGVALSAVGAPLDWQHQPFAPVFGQGVICYPLDRFLAEFPDPFPSHIKIDVDGAEDRVVAGARATLADPRLRSLLIELNLGLDTDAALMETLRASGFELAEKNGSPLGVGSPHQHVYNCLFRKP